jgi:hypothetical protein
MEHELKLTQAYFVTVSCRQETTVIEPGDVDEANCAWRAEILSEIPALNALYAYGKNIEGATNNLLQLLADTGTYGHFVISYQTQRAYQVNIDETSTEPAVVIDCPIICEKMEDQWVARLAPGHFVNGTTGEQMIGVDKSRTAARDQLMNTILEIESDRQHAVLRFTTNWKSTRIATTTAT